jgi:hypothetical protein
MISIGKMIERLDGLRDTRDLTAWENTFVMNMVERYQAAGKSTSSFSDKQVETVEAIYNKHFG